VCVLESQPAVSQARQCRIGVLRDKPGQIILMQAIDRNQDHVARLDVSGLRCVRSAERPAISAAAIETSVFFMRAPVVETRMLCPPCDNMI